MAIKKIIEERKFDISEAVTGQEAVDLLKNEKFDIIILDYNMPGLNGLVVLKIIRNRGDNTPVIVVSANQQESTIAKFHELGISGMLKKAANKEDFLSLIDKTLNTEGK